jgi:branched-chain amino acid transport system substrate-binding protein
MKNQSFYTSLKPYFSIFIPILILLLTIGVFYFQKNITKPIKIGFVGNLTGRLSNWGVSTRNGMLLLIEEINAAGGIRGHPIEVIIKDDQQDPELTVQAVDELIKEGVVAIIGPTLSATAITAVPFANEKQMLLISPSASTNALTGQDDFFFRVAQPNAQAAADFASFLFHEKGLRDVSFAFEQGNYTYANDFYLNFKKNFEHAGGVVTLVPPFLAGSGYAAVARELLQTSPEGVFLVASDIDTARICQELRKLDADVPVFASGLAKTEDLIKNGGAFVEGIFLLVPILDDKNDVDIQNFKKAYGNRFGVEQFFPAVSGYNSATVLIEALKKSTQWTPQGLKETILEITHFKSPEADFEIDRYGDAIRQRIIVTIKDGKYVKTQ